MIRKIHWLFFSLLIAAIFLRKSGFGFSTLLINLLVVLLCLSILLKPVLFKNSFPRIVFSFFLILSAAILQYWIQNKVISALIFTVWIVFSVFTLHTIRRNIFGLSFWIVISFIFLTSLIFNPRQFHNIYRASTYEEYIRSKYPEQRGIVADYFIDKHKKPDKEKAAEFLNDALRADTLKEYEHALKFYNKSIDLNPDDPFAYYKRGYLKLTRLDLNEENATSAIKDFNRAIRLQPSYTEAYFQRGLAFGYIGNQGRSLVDLKKVWITDSLLTDEEFFKRYGSSKETFSVPFHP